MQQDYLDQDDVYIVQKEIGRWKPFFRCLQTKSRVVQEGGSRRHDHETRSSFLGYLFNLRYRWLILNRFIFFIRHLAGLNHSGLDTKLRQNNCLKQKPDGHHSNYQQQPIHDTTPHTYFNFSIIENINIPARKSIARDDLSRTNRIVRFCNK